MMMGTEAEVGTKPETTDGTKDDRVRHLVKCLNPGEPPPAIFAKHALCGERVMELLTEHNGKICQKCVDIQRKQGN